MMDLTKERGVSIVIPAYNADVYLERTVASALNLGSLHTQVIIVDDGSTDRTAAIAAGLQAEDPRVTLISQSNAGVSVARNEGLRYASQPYICFLDADDLLISSGLSKLVATLEENAGAVAAYGRVKYIDADGALLRRKDRRLNPSGDLSSLLLSRNLIDTPGAILLRTSVVISTGGFPSGVKIAEDWNLYAKVAQLGLILFVNEPVLKYRLHAVSVMGAAPLTFSHWDPAIKATFSDKALTSRHEVKALVDGKIAREIDIAIYLVQRARSVREIRLRLTDLLNREGFSKGRALFHKRFWRLVLGSTKRIYSLQAVRLRER